MRRLFAEDGLQKIDIVKRFARANGMTVNRILWTRALRNALPPVITLFCQYVSYLIAGSAVVEKVFSIKGVGNYLMNCIMAADANAIGACMLIIATLYLCLLYTSDAADE